MAREKRTKTKKTTADDFCIQTPEEEYNLYVTQKIEQLLGAEEQTQAELYREAQEFGIKMLQSLKTPTKKGE